MKIGVINGPNLNMLGKRDQSIYGKRSLEELQEDLRNSWPDHEFVFFQSNHEGDIIDFIQKRVLSNDIQGLIINCGGFSHNSVAIRDALAMLEIPKVEAHISNIHAREDFRHTSITAGACSGVVAGFGFGSYHLAVSAIENLAG